MSLKRCFTVVPLLALPAAASAQTPEEETDSSVAVAGYVDVFYGFNAAFPQDRVNFPGGFGATAKRSNEFGLNLAAIDLSVDPEPVGLRLILSGGSFADVIHASEPKGPGAGPDVFRYVQTAAVSWQVSSPLLLEAGIMPSHIGYELVFTRDNPNYTHAWISDLTPYYQTGVRAQYVLSATWTAQLLVLNGWQLIGDNNDAKSIGVQLRRASGPASISLSGLAGPELAGDDEHWRYLVDVVAQLRATPWLDLAAQADLGWQEVPNVEANATWRNAALWARIGSDALWLALRVEYVHDTDTVLSGASQNLRSLTATIAYQAVKPLLLKLESRHDRSSADVFPAAGAGSLRRDQTLVVIGAVASF